MDRGEIMSGIWDDGSGLAGWSPGGYSREPDPMEDFFDYSIEYDRQDPEYEKDDVYMFAVGAGKKGYKNHHLLGPEAEYLGQYYTEEKRFNLVKSVTGMLLVTQGENSILGELYRTQGHNLKAVDEAKSTQNRIQITILGENGDKKTAWIFYAKDSHIQDQTGIRRVKDGHLEFLA